MDHAAIFNEAKEAAKLASKEMLEKWGGDHGTCGFAWVIINPARGPFITWLKKQITAAGEGKEGREQRLAIQNAEQRYGSKSWDKGWNIWNPGESRAQTIDMPEAGAKAFAEVLRKYGIDANWGSRID